MLRATGTNISGKRTKDSVAAPVVKPPHGVRALVSKLFGAKQSSSKVLSNKDAPQPVLPADPVVAQSV